MDSGIKKRKKDVIEFGHFPEGKTLRWIVMKEVDGKALLICANSVTSKSYHVNSNEAGPDVRDGYLKWSNSNLRNNFLNDYFYNNAFSAAEKKIIIKTTLSNPVKDSKTGKVVLDEKTEDMVFLLGTEDEAFPEYSVLNWKRKTDKHGWWLRTTYTGNQGDRVATIYYNDDHEGLSINLDRPSRDNYVRPMIWIDYNTYKNKKEEASLLIRELVEDYWRKHSKEEQKLRERKDELEKKIELFKNQNERVSTINVQGIIDKLNRYIEILTEHSKGSYANSMGRAEITDYINKANNYVEQLKPIAEETKDLEEEYSKMCRELNSINMQFKRIEDKARKRLLNN